MLRIGLIVNPYAGIGGPLGFKGSDGAEIRQAALAQVNELRAPARVDRCLQKIAPSREHFEILSAPGAMGAQACGALGLPHRVVDIAHTPISEAEDTKSAVTTICKQGVDLLLFAGGDGTARDVLDAIPQQQVVLGIPCGVKMHSGVFAVSPEAAGELLLRLIRAGLVNLQQREVRDIDEVAFREGQVRAKFYGEMLVPEEGHFLQHTKVSGVESDELISHDIAAAVVERSSQDVLYIIGPGTTTLAIEKEIGVEGTLLGVDAIHAGKLVCADASAEQLLALLQQYEEAEIFVTAIGGQGHVLGRGNQQLSPEVVRAVGLENFHIVAGKGKISALEGRPLLVDSNDPVLDDEMSGYRRVVTGYQDEILYPLATSS
jgi:predicted polyphosphate/ATP-dependent NAD kinase